MQKQFNLYVFEDTLVMTNSRTAKASGTLSWKKKKVNSVVAIVYIA